MAESVAQFEPAVPLPSFRSRYCRHSLVLPDLVADRPCFVAAVIEFARAHSPRVILPTGDATISLLRPCRQRLAELGCVLALALEIAVDKDRTLAVAKRLGIPQLRSMRIESSADLAGPTAEFGSLRAKANHVLDRSNKYPDRPRRCH
jgi:hypothetical protein